ncbi:MAG: hypothetical protein PF545_00075 [Elusimicrobia bacterium]|nr:hypothetical protein [Elusimicrobiota bacterium]
MILLNKKLFYPILAVVILTVSAGCYKSYAGSKDNSGAPQIKFIGELPTPGEFTLFANGGWTGNWYVGNGHGWISKIALPQEKYTSLYMGARLGRSKTNEQIKKATAVALYSDAGQKIIEILQDKISNESLEEIRDNLRNGIDSKTPDILVSLLAGKVNEDIVKDIKLIIREALSEVSEISVGRPYGTSVGRYNIMIGISKSKEKRPEGEILVSNDSIPREGAGSSAFEDISESRWFWVKTEKEKIPDGDGAVYIHLWTESKELQSTETAPILAGGIGSNDRENSYIVIENEYKMIKYFEPALALKTVNGAPTELSIEINTIKNHPTAKQKYLVSVAAYGKDITGTWLELKGENGWQKIGYYIDAPPYEQTFNREGLPAGNYHIRAVAQSWSGGRAYSAIKKISVE